MKKLVWLLLLSVVLSACGSSTSSLSNSASGVSVAKSVFNRTESSTLQGTASQVIKSSVSGSAIATYNPVNGQVVIPQMQVSGDTSGATYSIEMVFQGGFFLVTSAMPVGTAALTSSMATFTPSSGAVTVPFMVAVGDTSGTQYTVSLRQQDSSMNFSVANVVLAQKLVFTTAMLSGKSFSVGSGTVTFYENGTVFGSSVNRWTYNETWIINSSGQLVIYNTRQGTVIFTLISGDATVGWTASGTYSNGTSDIETIVPVTEANYTVFDPATNLVWQKNDDNTKRNWNEAVAYCAGLVLNNFNDWRLPSKDELKGLNYSSVFSQINGTYFAQVNGTYIGSYWSNTSLDNSQAYHVFLQSNAQNEGYANKLYYYNLVRCVRP